MTVKQLREYMYRYICSCAFDIFVCMCLIIAHCFLGETRARAPPLLHVCMSVTEVLALGSWFDGSKIPKGLMTFINNVYLLRFEDSIMMGQR